MTDEELRDLVIGLVCELAPDIAPEEVQGETNLREELELDSMDFLNFAIALHDRLRVDIPETDYPKLVTLNGAVAYLKGKVAA